MIRCEGEGLSRNKNYVINLKRLPLLSCQDYSRPAISVVSEKELTSCLIQWKQPFFYQGMNFYVWSIQA